MNCSVVYLSLFGWIIRIQFTSIPGWLAGWVGCWVAGDCNNKDHLSLNFNELKMGWACQNPKCGQKKSNPSTGSIVQYGYHLRFGIKGRWIEWVLFSSHKNWYWQIIQAYICSVWNQCQLFKWYFCYYIWYVSCLWLTKQGLVSGLGVELLD